jgi:hypothetical protein
MIVCLFQHPEEIHRCDGEMQRCWWSVKGATVQA